MKRLRGWRQRAAREVIILLAESCRTAASGRGALTDATGSVVLCGNTSDSTLPGQGRPPEHQQQRGCRKGREGDSTSHLPSHTSLTQGDLLVMARIGLKYPCGTLTRDS